MRDQLIKINSFFTTRPIVILSFLFILVQVFLFYKTGIVTSLEAEKYIIEGNLLYDKGEFSAPKYIFYLPVILLVYLCRLTGTPYGFIALVQIIFSGIALYYFYKLGKKTGNATIAFWSSALLALFIPLQQWNLFLYSDSFFISLSIIFSYVVYNYGEKSVKGLAIILLFLMLLVFTRPNGILFVPPVIIFLLFRRGLNSRLRLVIAFACIVLVAAMYFLLNTAFKGGGDLDALRPFIEEHIICFVPTRPDNANLNIIRTQRPVNDIFYYIAHNPSHFLRLTGLKLISFFNLTRSYYSLPHNILLAVFIIPMYLFALKGIFVFRRLNRNFSLFLVALLILYPLGISFQCDDWHSRFTMIIIPYLILLSSHGFFSIIRKKGDQ